MNLVRVKTVGDAIKAVVASLAAAGLSKLGR